MHNKNTSLHCPEIVEFTKDLIVIGCDWDHAAIGDAGISSLKGVYEIRDHASAIVSSKMGLSWFQPKDWTREATAFAWVESLRAVRMNMGFERTRGRGKLQRRR